MPTVDPNSFDIQGWVTRHNVRCTDGRTIKPEAFAHQNGAKVPMLWHHMNGDPTNVLGHMILEHRPEGVWGYAKFNDTAKAQHAKSAVFNEDVNSFSISANRLSQNGSDVVHGTINEVSLVLVGANPEARIDNTSFRHSDGSVTTDEDEAIIHFDEEFEVIGDEELYDDDLEFEDDEVELEDDEEVEHADGEEETLGDILGTLSPKQLEVVEVLIYQAAGGAEVQHSDLGGNQMPNLFEQNNTAVRNTALLKHSLIPTLMDEGFKSQSGKLSDLILKHADTELQMLHADNPESHGVAGIDYGIKDIQFLFPDHKNLTDEPSLYGRDTSWVAGVIAEVHRTPFSRIKSMFADITGEEARAKGYSVKGKFKKEEVFKLLKRTTSPTTVYKKQKLDRDDVLDIVDINILAFVKAEMHHMLREEIARSYILGDGRAYDHEDKIADPMGDTNGIGIRSIYHDNDLYAHRAVSEYADEERIKGFMEQVIRQRVHYRGKGSAKLYMGNSLLVDMLLLEDKVGRRLYSTLTELAAALGVREIVEIPLFEGVTRKGDEDEMTTTNRPGTTAVSVEGRDLVLDAIYVNLNDYTVGADKGGQTALFEDFDIDFNQLKFLLETRMSAALKDPKTALIFEHAVKGSLPSTDGGEQGQG